MKKLILFSFALFLAFSLTAYAHAGSTRDDGGHYDNKTGEYHYHHGYPAHQHYNGYCPYNYDDQTNHEYNGSSINGDYYEDGEYIYRETPPEETRKYHYTPKLKYNNGYKDIPISLSLIFISLSIAGIVIAIGFVYNFFNYIFFTHIKFTKNPAKYFKSALFTIDEVDDIINRLLDGESSLSISNPPEGAEIDEEGKPHQYINQKDLFTVFISKNGAKFHSNPTCATNLSPINYIDTNLSPCKKCKPVIPDTKWYSRYKEIEKIRNRFYIKSK